MTTSNDILFEGSAGSYREVDLKAWGDIGPLISFDSDLASLGFELIGDLLCSAIAHIILRTYVDSSKHTRAFLMVTIKNQALTVFCVMFDSKFADEAVATTTTSKVMKDLPAKGAHRKNCEWKGVYDLHGHHQRHVEVLQSQHGLTQPWENTLLSIAHSLDSFTIKMSAQQD